MLNSASKAAFAQPVSQVYINYGQQSPIQTVNYSQQQANNYNQRTQTQLPITSLNRQQTLAATTIKPQTTITDLTGSYHTATAGESRFRVDNCEVVKSTSKIVSVRTYRIVNGVKTLISDETGDRSYNHEQIIGGQQTYIPQMQQAVTVKQVPSVTPSTIANKQTDLTTRLIQTPESTKKLEGKLDVSTSLSKFDSMVDPSKHAQPVRQYTGTFGMASIPETNSMQSQTSVNNEAVYKSSTDQLRFGQISDQTRTVSPTTNRTYLTDPVKLNFDYQNQFKRDVVPVVYQTYDSVDKGGSILREIGFKIQPLDYVNMQPSISVAYTPEQSSGKVHSLKSLKNSLHSPPRRSIDENRDFYRVAKEIKDKLDELIDRERYKEVVSPASQQLADHSDRLLLPSRQFDKPLDYRQSRPIKNTGIQNKLTARKRDNQCSSKSPIAYIDLSQVKCCADCRRVQKDRQDSIIRCMKHKQKDTNLSRSRSPITIATNTTHEEDCRTPDDLGVCRTQRRLFAGTGVSPINCPKSGQKSRSKSPNLVTEGDKLKKIRENLHKAKLRRQKAKDESSNQLDFVNYQPKKQSSSYSQLTQVQKNSEILLNSWMEQMKDEETNKIQMTNAKLAVSQVVL